MDAKGGGLGKLKRSPAARGLARVGRVGGREGPAQEEEGPRRLVLGQREAEGRAELRRRDEGQRARHHQPLLQDLAVLGPRRSTESVCETLFEAT